MSNNETDDVELARKAFGAMLRVEMARAGLNKRELANATGISESTIGNYWRDQQTPRIPEILDLARGLRVTPEHLFTRIMEEHARIVAGE